MGFLRRDQNRVLNSITFDGKILLLRQLKFKLLCLGLGTFQLFLGVLLVFIVPANR